MLDHVPTPVEALLTIRTLHSWHNLFEQCFVCNRPGPCETWRQAHAALDYLREAALDA